MKTCVVSHRIEIPGPEPGPDCSSVIPATTTPQPGSTTEDPGGGGGGCVGQLIERACRLADLRDETMHWTMQVLEPQYGGRFNQPFTFAEFFTLFQPVYGNFPTWCSIPVNFPVIGLKPSGIIQAFGGGVVESVNVTIVKEALGFGNCQWRFGSGHLVYFLPGPVMRAGAGQLTNIVPQIQCPPEGTGPVQIDITAQLVPIMVGPFPYNLPVSGFPFRDLLGCPVPLFMLSGAFHLRITGG